ncbi:MAG TPA: hypothetical protein ENN28_02405 [Candidatus Uhrbacteria bacterium]|mgnify:CR=1 FL=1|nr:hypothetical protein [Candidatus Uhrbacteria bacterium]
MKVLLIYRGEGFEASKFINMPALLQPGMEIGTVLGGGISQIGTEWFPVHSVSFHVNQRHYILKLRNPIKCGLYRKSANQKLTSDDFAHQDWQIKNGPRIEPYSS